MFFSVNGRAAARVCRPLLGSHCRSRCLAASLAHWKAHLALCHGPLALHGDWHCQCSTAPASGTEAVTTAPLPVTVTTHSASGSAVAACHSHSATPSHCTGSAWGSLAGGQPPTGTGSGQWAVCPGGPRGPLVAPGPPGHSVAPGALAPHRLAAGSCQRFFESSLDRRSRALENRRASPCPADG